MQVPGGDMLCSKIPPRLVPSRRILKLLDTISLNNSVSPGNLDVAEPISDFPQFSKALCVAPGVVSGLGLHVSCYGGWSAGIQVLNLSQFSSVVQLCPTLCNPIDRSMSGLPVHHQLLEFSQTHVHWVGDAIQPSHPLSSPSPPALNLSQHQGLFQWVNSSHEMSKVLELQL